MLSNQHSDCVGAGIAAPGADKDQEIDKACAFSLYGKHSGLPDKRKHYRKIEHMKTQSLYMLWQKR